MKTYALIFRMNLLDEAAQPTETQMKSYMASWSSWVNEMDAAGQLAEGGNHFSKSGRVLRPGGIISEGPYEADNESVAGYLLVYARNVAGATAIAGKCPILGGEGTSVEIRELGEPGA